MKALLAIALAGCTTVDDDIGPWQPAASITGLKAPELGPPPAPRPPPVGPPRIATWNVHFGGDPEGLAQSLAGDPALADIDVLMVQEIEAYPGEPGTRASRLAAALGMTWFYAPARPKDDGTHGIAILARYPLLDPEVRQLPYYESIGQENRIAMAALLDLGDRQLELVNVHLDVRLGANDRIHQLAPAITEFAGPLILAGDFNSAPWAWADSVPLFGVEAIAGQDQAAVLDDYLGGNDFAIAIPAGTQTLLALPSVRCDDVYARSGTIGAAAVEHITGSDHWPVWADVDL
jgi:endonuclease/exonuclease/phosphatase family metal-dependent hydrolase